MLEVKVTEGYYIFKSPCKKDTIEIPQISDGFSECDCSNFNCPYFDFFIFKHNLYSIMVDEYIRIVCTTFYYFGT